MESSRAHSRWWRTARWAAVAAVVVGLAWFFRHMEWRRLGAALARASLWPLVAGAALSFVNLFCKGACWRIMLAPRHRVPLLRLFRYTVTAFAVSAVTPLRAGEALRVWMLRRRDGVPAADSLAVAAGEKLLDGVSMLVLIGPLPFLLPGLPAWVGRSILLGSAVAASLLGVVYLFPGRWREPPGFGRQFVAGLEALRSPGRFAASLAVLVASWVADLAEVWLVLHALGLDLPLAAGLLVLLTLNLAIMLPSTPAQMGALELGAVAGLTVLGVPAAEAMAFALLYHGMQVVPLVLVGMADYRFVLGAHRQAAAEGAG